MRNPFLMCLVFYFVIFLGCEKFQGLQQENNGLNINYKPETPGEIFFVGSKFACDMIYKCSNLGGDSSWVESQKKKFGDKQNCISYHYKIKSQENIESCARYNKENLVKAINCFKSLYRNVSCSEADSSEFNKKSEKCAEIICGFENVNNIGDQNSKNPSEIIKLSFHVMSKCPYGAQVVAGVKPALDKLGKAVDFELNFIGNEKDGRWMPLHGEPELKGDKIFLCAKKYLPEKYMDIVLCMSQNKEFSKIPDNLDACLTETKLNGDKIKACADGEEGTTLVDESYKVSIAKGANGSPTIYINDEPYQGGRGESDFLRSICEKYTTAKPAACLSIPELVKVKVTMITDKRCPLCQAEKIAQNLKGVFPGLEAEILDYADEKGKAEYQKYAAKGHNLLPIIVFDAEAKKDEGYAKIQKWTQEVDDKLILKVGAKFDPTKEICDNKVDDTGNGKVDCDDDDCKSELVCRAEIKKKLDVFVMSQCPYDVMALDAMEEVLQIFKEDKIDFNINFIATETEPGKFQALHGQPEVDENIRELCSIKHYPKNYMDYILCRNKNIRSNEWKECAKGAIKADVMEKCFTGGEGVKLHSENIKIANSMSIGGSPTWIINNKHRASGVSAADIQRNLCTHNPDLKGCSKTVKQQDKPAPKGGCGG